MASHGEFIIGYLITLSNQLKYQEHTILFIFIFFLPQMSVGFFYMKNSSSKVDLLVFYLFIGSNIFNAHSTQKT